MRMQAPFEDFGYRLWGDVLQLGHRHLNTNSYEIIQVLSGGGSALFERPLIPGDEDMNNEEFLIHCFKDSPNLESILRRERRAAKRLERKNRRKNKGKQEAPTDDSYELIRIPHGLRTLREGVFSYCIHLERVELPDTLRQIDKHAFLGCTSLKKLVIPEGTLSIGSRAFEGCRLEDVFIPASVTKIADDAFIGKLRGKSVTLEIELYDADLYSIKFE
jgi:hypothetical protein